MVGQRHDVWLLAGGFSGGTFNRECAVPAGKELFLPIFNSFGIDTPGICGQAGSLSVAELRSGAAGVVDSATIVSVTLDGAPVKNVPRVQSTVFEISLPEVNVFDAPCESFGDVRAGVYSPAVADGYYVRLKPLPAGQHTLKFRTELFESGGSIPQDITYTLNVTPVILK